ncbi:hypothetical protein D3C74_496880 [compost metagenome]
MQPVLYFCRIPIKGLGTQQLRLQLKAEANGGQLARTVAHLDFFIAPAVGRVQNLRSVSQQ